MILPQRVTIKKNGVEYIRSDIYERALAERDALQMRIAEGVRCRATRSFESADNRGVFARANIPETFHNATIVFDDGVEL